MSDLQHVRSANILRPDFRASGDDIDLIHGISTELIGGRERAELYGKIVDAAVSMRYQSFMRTE